MRVEAKYLVERTECIALRFRKGHQSHDSVAPRMHDDFEVHLFTSIPELCLTLLSLLGSGKMCGLSVTSNNAAVVCRKLFMKKNHLRRTGHILIHIWTYTCLPCVSPTFEGSLHQLGLSRPSTQLDHHVTHASQSSYPYGDMTTRKGHRQQTRSFTHLHFQRRYITRRRSAHVPESKFK